MESKVKDSNFFLVSGWMVQKLQLAGNELMIFAIINGFSQDDQSTFNGSLKYLEDFTGASRTTVITALKSLVEKKVIEKISKDINGVIFNSYKIVQGVQKLYGGVVQNPNGGSTKSVRGGGTESVPNNIAIDNKDNNTNTDVPINPVGTKEKKTFTAPTIEEVTAYFIENGYKKEAAIKAHEYYRLANWHDSKGAPVKNWKQKMNGVWFKPENLAQPKQADIFSNNQNALGHHGIG